MPSPEMIPYNPLIPDQIPENGFSDSNSLRPEEYVFETMTLSQKLIGCLVILPLYFYLLPHILIYLLNTLSIFRELSADTLNFLLNLGNDVILFLLLILLFRSFLKQSFLDLRRFSVGHYFKCLGIGYAFFMAANFAFSIPTAFLSDSVISQNQEGIINMSGHFPLGLFILAVFTGPVLEELIFRGIIFRTLRPIGRIPAILISAVSFGLMHVFLYVAAGDFSELVMSLPYIGMGVALGLLYEKRKNILLNMSVHILQNLIGYSVVLLLSPYLSH